MPDQPLVSCICITHKRVDFLKRSIQCFLGQTYPNKELVVVYTDDDLATDQFMRHADHTLVKAVKIAANTFTLGEKRNLAIEESSGFYFCAWDDDDWYGNKRIEFQVQWLRDTQYKSSVLSRLLIYDASKNEAYLSSTRWAWEQTILCEKALTINSELRYAPVERGEDSVFVFKLRENDLLLTLSNPLLYIYVYHGQNTWHRKHWEDNIIRWATKLSPEQSTLIKHILDGDYQDEAAGAVLEKTIRIE